MENQNRNKAVLTGLIFAEANRMKLSYCLLRNILRVQDGSSKDVDVLVHPRDLKLFSRVVERLAGRDPAWSIFQIISGRAGTRLVLYHRDDYTLLFDLQSSVYLSGGSIPAPVFLQQPVAGPGGIQVLDLVSYLTCLQLHDEIKHKPEYSKELRRVFADDPALKITVLANIRELTEKYTNGQFARLIVRASIIRRVNTYLFPPGPFIVVHGPDGVGKTTTLAVLEERFKRLRIAYRVKHFGGKTGTLPGRPKSLSRPRPGSGVSSHPGIKKILDIPRFLYHAFDIWLYYWLVVRRYQMGGGIFICDKYFTYALKAESMGFQIPGWLIAFVYRCMPCPDLFLLFWNLPEVIASRKNELTAEEAVVAASNLERIKNHSRRWEKIKTSGDIESVADRLFEIIRRGQDRKYKADQGDRGVAQ